MNTEVKVKNKLEEKKNIIKIFETTILEQNGMLKKKITILVLWMLSKH